jgi:23S rRNA pseudouridine2605 synthase
LVRLNKYIADCGVCARRKADELIASGQVTVDGRIATLGQSIDPANQVVALRGKRLAAPPQEHVMLVLNKPRGVVTTMHDERGRPTVAHLLPKGRKLFPVGRLDAESTGVLLCTTDGAAAQCLTHPSFGVEKRYRVRIEGPLTDENRAALGAIAAKGDRDKTTTFDVVLHEGRNRQVRRMCAQRGLRVLDLQRISFGPVTLRGLAAGRTRQLSQAERAALDRIVRAASTARRAPVRPTE